jgi:hypothetical protein
MLPSDDAIEMERRRRMARRRLPCTHSYWGGVTVVVGFALRVYIGMSFDRDFAGD